MRNPDRLDSSYLQLCEIHKKSFPDMREAQYLLNLLGWINTTKKRDPFSLRVKNLLHMQKNMQISNSLWYQGWDLLNK